MSVKCRRLGVLLGPLEMRAPNALSVGIVSLTRVKQLLQNVNMNKLCLWLQALRE